VCVCVCVCVCVHGADVCVLVQTCVCGRVCVSVWRTDYFFSILCNIFINVFPFGITLCSTVSHLQWIGDSYCTMIPHEGSVPFLYHSSVMLSMDELLLVYMYIYFPPLLSV